MFNFAAWQDGKLLQIFNQFFVTLFLKNTIQYDT